MNNYTWSLEEIFNNKIFRVPDYQRGYAWETDHCKDLLEDLELLEEGLDHYTGTLVFFKNGITEQDAEGGNYTGFDIVDGQQRLTSIVILLSVIKSFLPTEQFESLANGIGKKYLHTNRLSDGNPMYKLTLNKDCAEFFRTDILGPPSVMGITIRSHERLATAKTVFTDYLTEKHLELNSGFYPWLTALLNKVTHRLKMGLYIVNNKAEVGVIFEVMNNRGKELTELEKVKNYLLYLTTKINLGTVEELVNLVNGTWSNIYTRFMTAELDTQAENQFLRAHWLMYHDYARKNWKGSKSIKSKFNLREYQGRSIELFNDLKVYVKSLDDGSIAFADLEKPTREDAFNSFHVPEERQRVKYWSEKLVRTGTLASFRPLLMAIRLKFPTDAQAYEEMVKLLEKYAFRVYNMHGNRADTGQSSIFYDAYTLYNDEVDLAHVMVRMRTLLNYYSKHSAFNSYWEFDQDDNNWYNWWPIKYLLYEYEEHLSNGKGVKVTWESVVEKKLENTIEHILPQTYHDKQNYWPQRFTEEQFKIYLHDLGNLCLTYDNSSYQNNGFDLKKGVKGQAAPCYSNSVLIQENNLVLFDDWTSETIEQRRKAIVDWARVRWYENLDAYQDEVDEVFEEDEGVETEQL